ncbi:MAG: hypothetical protein WCG25_02585 [bacterium]
MEATITDAIVFSSYVHFFSLYVALIGTLVKPIPFSFLLYHTKLSPGIGWPSKVVANNMVLFIPFSNIKDILDFTNMLEKFLVLAIGSFVINFHDMRIIFLFALDHKISFSRSILVLLNPRFLFWILMSLLTN